MSRRLAVLVLVLGWAAIAAAVLATARAAPEIRPAWIAVGGAAWAACLAVAARARSDGPAPPLLRSRAWWCVLAGALALRAPALVQGPVFSDDVYRYVWEGALVARGIDPYAHAPSDPALAGVRAELPTVHARVNHPDVPAAYPPLAQLAHAGIVVAARAAFADAERGALLLVRAFHAACDVGVLWAIAALLARRGRSPLASLAWGWCPLLAFEFAGSAHLDAFAILPALGAWLVATGARPRERWGAPLLACAALVKLLPIAFVPAWLRQRREVRAAALVVACVLIAGSAPMWAGHAVPDGLRTYAERWEGASVVYRGVLALARLALACPGGDAYAPLVARAIVVVAWLAVLAWAWRRGGAGLDLARVAVAAFLVLTPVLHPWYLAWIAPFVALRADVEWVWMLAAAPLLYAPLAQARAGGAWVEPAWTWPVLVLPFLALAALRWRACAARARS